MGTRRPELLQGRRGYHIDAHWLSLRFGEIGLRCHRFCPLDGGLLDGVVADRPCRQLSKVLDIITDAFLQLVGAPLAAGNDDSALHEVLYLGRLEIKELGQLARRHLCRKLHHGLSLARAYGELNPSHPTKTRVGASEAFPTIRNRPPKRTRQQVCFTYLRNCSPIVIA